VVSATSRPVYRRERVTVGIIQETGWVPGLVWTGAENLAPIEIRSLDRSACSVLKHAIIGWTNLGG